MRDARVPVDLRSVHLATRILRVRPRQLSTLRRWDEVDGGPVAATDPTVSRKTHLSTARGCGPGPHGMTVTVNNLFGSPPGW